MTTQIRPFDNSEDILDTRDLEAAISELEDAIKEELHAEGDETALAVLKEFRQELVDNFGDSCLEYGVILIRDSHFEDYAQELAEDIGAIGKHLQWPLYHIDWTAAAASLKMDYSLVAFDGVEYWGRE